MLDEEGIEYSQRLEAFMHETSSTCYQGIMFEVLAGQAEHCRRLLRDRGLARGVV